MSHRRLLPRLIHQMHIPNRWAVHSCLRLCLDTSVSVSQDILSHGEVNPLPSLKIYLSLAALPFGDLMASWNQT